VDLTGVPVRKRGVGFCFQHYAPFRHLTVRRNVAFGLEIRHRPKAEIRAKVDELLELVRIAHLADRYPSQLSGGQRQRMALARALAIEPKVLLLDEPFGALDAQVRTELRQWLRALHEKISVTTVLVTHDQEEAMDVADRLAIVNEGRLEQVGSPAEIYDRPASPFVMRFVGPTTERGGAAVRPHDLVIHRGDGDGGAGHPATVERVTHLGFEVRVDLRLADGARTWVQLSRGGAADLALAPGDEVTVDARAALVRST
jgi:sulfate transport system ATP-binding protein